MQRRKLLWFAGVGITAVLVQGAVSAPGAVRHMAAAKARHR